MILFPDFCVSQQVTGGYGQDPLEFYGFLSPKLEALKMDSAFLNRNVNEGFSGAEPCCLVLRLWVASLLPRSDARNCYVNTFVLNFRS